MPLTRRVPLRDALFEPNWFHWAALGGVPTRELIGAQYKVTCKRTVPVQVPA
jgi:hypothetical protein